MMNVEVPSAYIRNVHVEAKKRSGLGFPDNLSTTCVFVANGHLCVNLAVDLMRKRKKYVSNPFIRLETFLHLNHDLNYEPHFFLPKMGQIEGLEQ